MRARRRFAQHFLEPAWVQKLTDAMAFDPSDAIVEIGPGRGALTLAVAPRVRTVVAIEIDRDLAALLRAKAVPNLTVIEGDVLAADLASIVAEAGREGPPGGRVRVVGNLPYAISSPILRRLVSLARQTSALHDATIMLQREVADRVLARPGSKDWGPLAIAVQLRAEVAPVLSLPPGAFRPAPRVQSAVIRLRFRPPTLPVADERVLDTVVRAAFGQRRKTLSNALRALASARQQDALDLIARAELDPRRRPETLDLAEFARLAGVFGRAAGAT
jgi:16S rRNA (adenine1518-N6/adenine1519-N6)-dimethyltransferase